MFKTMARNMVLDPDSATTMAEQLHLLETKWRNQPNSKKRLQKANYESIYGSDLEEDEAWWFMEE